MHSHSPFHHGIGEGRAGIYFSAKGREQAAEVTPERFLAGKNRECLDQCAFPLDPDLPRAIYQNLSDAFILKVARDRAVPEKLRELAFISARLAAG